MMRLVFIVLASLTTGLAARAQQVTEKKDLDGQEQAWLRWEEQTFDKSLRAESFKLGGLLPPDVKLKFGEKVFAGENFAAAFQEWKTNFEIVKLDERTVRFEGNKVTSTGLVSVRERVAQTAVGELKGVPVAASAKAEVSVAELARRESEKPPGPEKHVAIHPPMSIPDDLPAPKETSLTRYRYTIVYDYRWKRPARTKVVSLELTPVP